MTGRAQTIVCTAPAQPQAKQSVAPRKNRLPINPEKQLNNATAPVLIGYARVSRAEGQDLAPQVGALEAAGCRRIHEERASGGRWDRPELAHLLGRLTAGDVLVVWKLLYSGKSRLCVMAAFLLATFDLACGFAPRDQTSLRGRHQGRRNMGSEGRAVTSRPRRAGTGFGAVVNFQIVLTSPSVP